MYEPHYHPEYIVWAAGVVQSAVYLDFWGVYLEVSKLILLGSTYTAFIS
jgi:hypothetical protein